MLNWLRRLLKVREIEYYDGSGKKQPTHRAIERLFEERDKLVQDKHNLIHIIQKLPHESHCLRPPCICAKSILREPYN